MIRLPILLLLTAIFVACQHSDPAPLARLSSDINAREALVQSLPPGEEVPLLAADHPGVIRRVWFTCMDANPQVYGGLVLRAYWDGETEPSIETPLSDLAGVGFGEERTVHTPAFEMIPAGLPGHAAITLWLPMPFSSARITIENQWAEEVTPFFHSIDWVETDDLTATHGRLHAQWRRTNPIETGRHHTVLQAEGEGHFIGLVYSIRRLGEGAWVEGGEDFFIDLPDDQWAALKNWDTSLITDPDLRVDPEARNIANQPALPVWPTLPGIGGEDYFSQSWGFREEDTSSWHGVSLGPDDDMRMSAYRLHLADPIHFDENLWMIFRNHGWDVGPRADDISTLGLWYQTEPHLPFPLLPPLSDRLP